MVLEYSSVELSELIVDQLQCVSMVRVYFGHLKYTNHHKMNSMAMTMTSKALLFTSWLQGPINTAETTSRLPSGMQGSARGSENS